MRIAAQARLPATRACRARNGAGSLFFHAAGRRMILATFLITRQQYF